MKIRKLVDLLLERFLCLLMGVLVLNVLWQVASRYLLQHPSSFTDELAGFMLVWVGLLGAGYATGKNLNLSIDLLPKWLEGKPKTRLYVFIQCCIMLFALSVMVVGGSRLVYITLYLKQASPALGIQLGYVYGVLPMSGLLICYYCFDNIFTARGITTLNK